MVIQIYVCACLGVFEKIKSNVKKNEHTNKMRENCVDCGKRWGSKSLRCSYNRATLDYEAFFPALSV